MIDVWQIEKGPYKGRWAWRIHVAQQRTKAQYNRAYGRRTGIALSESKAYDTAARQLRWHVGDTNWGNHS